MTGEAEDRVSIWCGALDGTTWWEQDADTPHYAASLMKVPLAEAAQRRHDRGELDLDARVDVRNGFASAAGDGSRFALEQSDDQDDDTWAAVGATETLRELCRRSLVLSGNLATNVLLEHVGLEEVSAVLVDAGVGPATTVTRGIGDAPAREAGLDNLVTARDLARLMARLHPGIEAVLRDQHYRDAIPAGLPRGTTVANKTGWVDDLTHDMALVRPADGSEPFVLVVLTGLDREADAADTVIARVAAEAWERTR